MQDKLQRLCSCSLFAELCGTGAFVYWKNGPNSPFSYPTPPTALVKFSDREGM